MGCSFATSFALQGNIKNFNVPVINAIIHSLLNVQCNYYSTEKVPHVYNKRRISITNIPKTITNTN